jgi:membrane-bound lytic murein transglycosylase MltF
MPGTARQYGVDATDTAGNIQGGVAKLADMLQRYHGNEAQALAAYNWGEGHLDNAIARHGRMPEETEQYVSRILSAETGQTVTVGDVYVQIMEPHATAAEIGVHVQKGLTDAMTKQQRQTQRSNAQLAYTG